MSDRPMSLVAALSLLLAWAAAAAPADVTACFTPAEACAPLIVSEIDRARAEIRVQAYGFSARPILAALARARLRGVDAAVILDRSDLAEPHTGLTAMLSAGVRVAVDRVPGIAHIKAIVIDRHLVIGGSYNFTTAAERRNVEDVLVVDSPAVAALFLREWAARWSVAEPQ